MTSNTYTIDIAGDGEHYRRTITAAWYEIGDNQTTTVVMLYKTAHEKRGCCCVLHQQATFFLYLGRLSNKAPAGACVTTSMLPKGQLRGLPTISAVFAKRASPTIAYTVRGAMTTDNLSAKVL